jgi:hypothetical protein
MTVPECFDPDAGGRLLASARNDDGGLPADLATHLATCEVCRVARERARRMAEAWRELEPRATDVAAARARLVDRSPRRVRSRVLPGALAFAVLLLGAGAFAGARVASMRALHATTAPRAPATMLGEGTSAPRPPAVGHPRIPALQAVSASASSAPPAGADVRAPPPAPPEAHRLVQAPPSASNAFAGSRLGGSPQAPETRAAPDESAKGTVPGGGAWAAAADAMRAGDYAGAERAFGALARSDDPRTRDEARLARAQVLVAQGRAGEARAELEGLASSGATPLVRARAAEALREPSGRQLPSSGSGN